MHGQDKHNYINAIFCLCCIRGIGFTNLIEKENKRPYQNNSFTEGKRNKEKRGRRKTV